MADNLFFEACRKKYGNRCMFNGKVYDKAHHFFPKGQYPHLRYTLENGINLSMEYHDKVHARKDKKEVESKIIEIRGLDWYNDLKEKAHNMPGSFVNEKWFKENIIRLKEYLYD